MSTGTSAKRVKEEAAPTTTGITSTNTATSSTSRVITTPEATAKSSEESLAHRAIEISPQAQGQMHFHNCTVYFKWLKKVDNNQIMWKNWIPWTKDKKKKMKELVLDVFTRDGIM